MAFERFTEAGKNFGAKASISTRGTISFNRGARRQYGLDNFSYAIMYYDRETRQIAVEFTNTAEEAGAVKIRMREFGADVGAKSFLDYYDINMNVTTMFTVAKWPEHNGVIIDMSSGRARKSSEVDSADDLV